MKAFNNNNTVPLLKQISIMIDQIKMRDNFDQNHIDHLEEIKEELIEEIDHVFCQQEYWLYKFFGSTVSWIYSNHLLSPGQKQGFIKELTITYQTMSEDIERAKSGILLKSDKSLL